MRKHLFAIPIIGMLMIALCITACGNNTQTSSSASSSTSVQSSSVESSLASSASASEKTPNEPVIDGSAYGYAGDDPVEVAIYRYLAEVASKDFEKADVSIPTVSVVNVDYTNPSGVLVYGDFWVYNYNIQGNTLECISGGHLPGVMYLTTDESGYTVNTFNKVADGTDFDSSASSLFGEHYDAFMKVYSDTDAHDELRKITVSDYVKLNSLDVTQYQDYGWDPVELYT